jgi:hypothetical protein
MRNAIYALLINKLNKVMMIYKFLELSYENMFILFVLINAVYSELGTEERRNAYRDLLGTC